MVAVADVPATMYARAAHGWTPLGSHARRCCTVRISGAPWAPSERLDVRSLVAPPADAEGMWAV
ncbi:hypothetical protein J2X03_002237 [Microbacterium trichothecenolyticum]|nr:hypothetical protein [Microbacterium trichothecenolyticum]